MGRRPARGRSRHAKDRNAKSYARREPVREEYDYVLIVCEGQKTEPFYLQDLRSFYRLSNANIEITPASGSDPMSIVRFAEDRAGEGYDRMFCVFDRNGHANYDQALRRVRDSALGQAGKLTAITSWPCFEFWLLLHYGYRSAAFEAAGGRSPCENAIRALLAHFPGYAKGHKTVFADLHDKMEAAIGHARRLANDNAQTGSTNPATLMHELVEYLRGLKP
jgi:hypothetical protein